MADPNAALVDILGPPAPLQAPTHTLTILIGLTGVLLLVILVVWLVGWLPVWRTRLALWRLRRAHEAGRLDTRAAAYCLAATLRRHYRLRRLDAASMPAACDQQWAALLRRLDRLRYADLRGAPAAPAHWRRLSLAAARRLGRRQGRPR